MLKLVQFLSVALLLAAPTHAFADAAGSAKGVNPDADAAFNGEVRTLVVGADVFIGDLIETGPKGQVQILFADNTELVVGPGSSLKIEDYLIRNDGSAGKLAIDMLSGAFRFATGDSAKNRYEINTPTGTIGIRGTWFDVNVAPDGLAHILLYRGAIRFCTDDGKCKDLTDVCELGEIAELDTALLGKPLEMDDETREAFMAKFLYAENQTPLLRDFWFAHARDCVIKPPDTPEFIDWADDDPTPQPPKPPNNIINR